MLWILKEYWLELIIVLAPTWIVIFIGLYYLTGQHRKERGQ